nr:uncharacterized protein LOC111138466 isoform X2 [Crassostrea virginica]
MIKVTNIPPNTSEVALEFFFENRRRSGGGDIKKLKYDPDTKSAVITFEDPEAVKRVMGKLPLFFNEVQIGVEKLQQVVEAGMEDSQEDSEMILEVQEAKQRENAATSMIKVTNIPPNTTQELLEFFFGNRRRSGGGPIEELEYDPDTKSAVITFVDPEAVKRVMGKLPLFYYGVHIGVEKFQPDVQVGTEHSQEESEMILEVRGVSPSTSEDTVMMYFENTRRSGGGDVKTMIKVEDGVFHIIFEEEQVVDMVIRKKQHKIDGKAIEVRRFVPPPPPNPKPTYSNKVFIKNISEKTTKHELIDFLEAKTCILPVSIEYGKLKRTALVTFGEDVDFKKLHLACKENSLDKFYLEVARVPITNCVIVKNVSENTSQDFLEFYFNNELRSGVTGVLDIKKCDGYCLVYFEDPEAVDTVCSRTHKFLGRVLDVKEYHDCVVLDKSDEEGPFQPPDPVETSEINAFQHYVDCETCGRYSDFYCNACHQRMCDNCREDHLRNPDNISHKVTKYRERKMRFLSNPCKLHPTNKMVLCCKKCQKAICAICTTKEHEGHGFLDIEEVCTEKFRARFEDIRNIRDNVLPQSRVNLAESQRITKKTKDNIGDMKRIMMEKATRLKELVDTILTESLQELQAYEVPAVSGAENQEEKMVGYVSRMENVLEQYKTSISSENSEKFLSDMKKTPTVILDPIPALATANLSPFTFSEGELRKADIRKQFGSLQKSTEREKS